MYTLKDALVYVNAILLLGASAWALHILIEWAFPEMDRTTNEPEQLYTVKDALIYVSIAILFGASAWALLTLIEWLF